MLLAETDVRVGGRFRVRFRMLDGSEHESSGEYLEVVRPERLAMSWRWAGGEDPGKSLRRDRPSRQSPKAPNSPSPIRVCATRRPAAATRKAGTARSTSWNDIFSHLPTEILMTKHEIVSEEQWIEARRALLAEEKAWTRERDRLSEKRRALPWVRVEKNYVFEGAEGPVTLADLFDGRSQLIVYHFMFGPEWQEGCPGCSLLSRPGRRRAAAFRA